MTKEYAEEKQFEVKYISEFKPGDVVQFVRDGNKKRLDEPEVKNMSLWGNQAVIVEHNELCQSTKVVVFAAEGPKIVVFDAPVRAVKVGIEKIIFTTST